MQEKNQMSNVLPKHQRASIRIQSESKLRYPFIV